LTKGKKTRIFTFDESRFGLFSVKRRKITLKGVKPIGEMQTKYEYYWLYGAFDVLSGESFYWEYNKMIKLNLSHYIEQLSLNYPDSLNIVLMDNSKTHFIDNVPKNVKFVYIEPYCPELNPAERVWREFKDSMAWNNFNTIPELQLHISKIIVSLSLENIMSLTQYSYIIDAFYKLNKK